MSDASDLRGRVLAAVRAAPRSRANVRWVEVRVLAAYRTPEELAEAPHSFDIRDAVADLIADGKLVREPGYWFRLPESV